MRNNRAAEKRNEISMADTNVNGGTQQATGKLKSVESLDQTNEMERGLSNRHVQFIAIGGTIGTGLFLGSGKSISLTGPSIIFVYILVGVIMFFLWPVVQSGISHLGTLVLRSGYAGTWIYGILERALIPFGLHHVFYMPFWQTELGGSMMILSLIHISEPTRP